MVKTKKKTAKKAAKKKAKKVKAISKASTATRSDRSSKKKKPPKPATEKIETSPMPTADKSIKGFEQALDDQLAAHPKPQHGGARPGAGRKIKPPDPPEPEIEFIEPEQIRTAVVQCLDVPFQIWSAKTGLTMNLQPDESEMLAKPVMVLLNYYAPHLSAIAIAWASLGITAVAIMQPRIVAIREERKSRKLRERIPPTAGGAQPAGSGPAAPPAGGPVNFPGPDGYKSQHIDETGDTT